MGSSLGAGRASRRKVKRGCAFAPFTSHFSKRVKLGSNPPPGLTYLSKCKISSFLAFSYGEKGSWDPGPQGGVASNHMTEFFRESSESLSPSTTQGGPEFQA